MSPSAHIFPDLPRTVKNIDDIAANVYMWKKFKTRYDALFI